MMVNISIIKNCKSLTQHFNVEGSKEMTVKTQIKYHKKMPYLTFISFSEKREFHTI